MNIIKKTLKLTQILFIVVFMSACEKSKNSPDSYVADTFTNLDATALIIPQPLPDLPIVNGNYTKFSFLEGDTVNGENWDVAFRATSIIVNGGVSSSESQPNRTGNAAVYLIDGTMASVTSVDTSLLVKDSQNGTAIFDDMGYVGLGWCVYDKNPTSPTWHKVSPRPVILVFRTHDNKYAKIEIKGYYDSPNPDFSKDFGGYYTFDYVYQSDGSTSFEE